MKNYYTDDYTISDGVLVSLHREVPHLKIPKGVTGIRSSVTFYGTEYVSIPKTVKEIYMETFIACRSLKYVKLVNGLEEIGSYAFSSCINLDSITIPKTVKEIRRGAFECCYSLKTVRLVDGLEYIGRSTFGECSNLELMVIPSTVKEIGRECFKDCSSLKNVLLPSSIEKIEDEMFAGCKKLESINIPNSVKTIRNGAFIDCTSLKDVTLCEGLEEICSAAFNGCNLLESITIPKTVKIIYGECFKNCSSLENVTLNEGLNRISESAFNGCRKLKSIDIPKTVKSIGPYAFFNCRSLKSVKLHNGLEEIDEGAFKYCEKLEEIVIPPSVNTINNLVFFGCTNLKKVTIKYKSYEELFYLINNIKDNDISNNNQINLIFEGPKLTNKEQKTITKLIKEKNTIISFKENDFTQLIGNVFLNKKYDDDIQTLLDKINNICNYLPNNIKNNILLRISELLEKYQKDIISLKPIYDDSNNSLISTNLNTNRNIRWLKPELLSNLEMIIFNLSTADNLIKFLKELNKYKNLIDSDISNLNTEDTTSGNIKNIIYISSKLEEEKSKEIIDKLSKYIDDTINKGSLELNNLFNNSTLSNHINYESEFKLNISKLYDEVNFKYKDILPFQAILNSLNVSDKYCGDDELKDLIVSIKNIISEVPSEEDRNNLEDKLNQIIEKYTNLLNNIISDKDNLKDNNSVDIEINLRKDLQQVLFLIAKYENINNYRKDVANKINLLNLLEKAKYIISTQETDISTEEDYDTITSYVIEINNTIQNSDLIDYETKNKMKNELLGKLTSIEKLLEKDDINTIKEYNEYLNIILYSLVDIDLKTYFYLKDMEEYDSYSK